MLNTLRLEIPKPLLEVWSSSSWNKHFFQEANGNFTSSSFCPLPLVLSIKYHIQNISVLELTFRGNSLNRVWGALPPAIDLVAWPFSNRCTRDFICFLTLLETWKVSYGLFCLLSWLGSPHSHTQKKISRESHLLVKTNWNQYWVLSLSFSLFHYWSLFPSPEVPNKKIFFWTKAYCNISHISHIRPWLLNTERSLTCSWICLVFMLIKKFLFPAELCIFGLKPKEVWVEIVSAALWYINVFLFLLQDVFLHWKMIEW